MTITSNETLVASADVDIETAILEMRPLLERTARRHVAP